MSELAVYIPAEIALHPQDLVDEVAIPLLPASKIARGQLHPDRIPGSIARVADVTQQIEAAIQGLGSPGENDLSSEVDALFEAVEGKADVTHTHPEMEAAIESHTNATDPHPAYVKIADLAALPAIPIISAQAPSSPTLNQRWIDLTDGLSWRWNGAYWLSEQQFTASCQKESANAYFMQGLLPIDSTYDLLLKHFAVMGEISGQSSSSNFWSFGIGSLTSETGFPVLDTSTLNPGTFRLETVPDLFIETAAYGMIDLVFTAGQVGSNPLAVTFLCCYLRYHLVKRL
jgi:hypothetical protein